MGVDQTIAIIVADMQSATIPVCRAIDFPAWRAWVGLARRVGKNFLYVAVTETGIGLQHERHHAAHDWS